MVEAGRFVDGLKAAGVEFFAAVTVELLYGYYCTDMVLSAPWRVYQSGAESE